MMKTEKAILLGALIATAVLFSMGSRTYSELIASFQDNVIGAITPEDMRELVDAHQAPFGKITLNAPTLTTISTIGTWTEFEGTFTLNARSRGVTMTNTATGAKICNNSGNTWEFQAAMSISVATASNNQEYQVTLVSDVKGPINCLNLYSESRFAGIYESVGGGGTHFELDHGECLYAAVRNNTSTANFTAGTVLIFIMGISTAVDP